MEVGFYDAFAQDVAIAGKYAHVAVLGGLSIVDLADPAHPFEAAYDTPGDAKAVAVDGTRIYGADQSSGLWILQVTRSGHRSAAAAAVMARAPRWAFLGLAFGAAPALPFALTRRGRSRHRYIYTPEHDISVP